MTRRHRSTATDTFFVVVVFLPVATIAWGVGILLGAIMAAGAAVHTLNRRGRGPTTHKVFRPAYDGLRGLFDLPVKLWKWGSR